MADRGGGSSGTSKKGARPKWADAFFEALAEDPSPRAACAVAKVGKSTVYRWKNAHDWFEAEWEAAIQLSADEVRAFLHRAGKGKIEPKAPQVTAAIFLCKGHFPRIHGDKPALHVHADSPEDIARAIQAASVAMRGTVPE